MADIQSRIIEVFSDSGKRLLQANAAQSFELANLHDIHGFYRINNNLVMHCQGYPGMSNEEKMFFSIRLRDYEKMMQIREEKAVSIGNEHKSNFPAISVYNFGTLIPYDSDFVITKINEELKMFGKA